MGLVAASDSSHIFSVMVLTVCEVIAVNDLTMIAPSLSLLSFFFIGEGFDPIDLSGAGGAGGSSDGSGDEGEGDELIELTDDDGEDEEEDGGDVDDDASTASSMHCVVDGVENGVENEELGGETENDERVQTSRVHFAEPEVKTEPETTPYETGCINDPLPAVAACLDPHTRYWQSDRIDFLLHMFSGYTHGLRVFQALREELNQEFGRRERALRSRELRLFNDQYRASRGRELEAQERRLAAREAEISRRENDLIRRENQLDEELMSRLQEFLLEIEEWGMRAPSQEPPPTPCP